MSISHRLFACDHGIGRSRLAVAVAWMFFNDDEFDVRESKIRDDLRVATCVLSAYHLLMFGRLRTAERWKVSSRKFHLNSEVRRTRC